MEFEENNMLLSLDPSGIDICGNEKVTITSDGLVKIFNDSKSTNITSNSIEISGDNKITLSDNGIDICDNFTISYQELSLLDGVTSNIQQQITSNVLSAATNSELGGIKVGNNLSITGGVLSSSTTADDILGVGAVMTTGEQTIDGNKHFSNLVGIGGTNSTTSQLYIKNDNTAIHVTQTDDTARDAIKLHKNDTDYYGGIGFNNGLNITTPNLPITFATAATERMKISNDGKIGINQNNPTHTLDINGDINFTGIIKRDGTEFFGGFWSTTGNKLYYDTDNVGIGVTDPPNPLTVQGTAATGTMATAAIKYGDSTGSQYLFAGSTFGGILSSSGNGLYIQQTNGNVGIGTTNFNEKLVVSGNGIFTGTLKVNTTDEVATTNYVTNTIASSNAASATILETTRTLGGVSFNGSSDINLPGVNATGNQDTTGNAATASIFAATKNIGGVAFDGSSDINLPGVNATGNQDTTGNAASATILETARTLGGVSFNGSSNINLPGVNATGNQDTTGNAASATILETARTIGGVSFDGSSNINLPGVNANGNQDTTGNAASATILETARTIGGVSFNGSSDIDIGITHTGGKVGVKNINPLKELDVTGDIGASGTITTAGNVVATQVYVDNRFDTILGDSNLDTKLDTLKEIADALNNDASFGEVVFTKFNSIDTSFVNTESNITTNTNNISTNTSNISTNTNDITTNAANIATNTNNISTINTNIDNIDNKIGILNKTTEAFTVRVEPKTSTHPYHGQGSGSGYLINGIESPELLFKVGTTYTFDVTDATNGDHPFKFYLDANKTTEYTTDVIGAGTPNVSIQITESTPSKLYYQCGLHDYMGNYFRIEIERSDVTLQDFGQLSGATSNIQNQLDAIETSLVNTESATTTNTSNISTNTSNIDTNTSDITTNTTNITTNAGNISTINTKIDSIDNKIGILNKTTKTFTVTVASKTSTHPYHGQGSGSGYLINGIESPELLFKVGTTYTFDVTDATNGDHPFKFYLDANKTTEYTTDITITSSPSNVSIQITESTPSKLYYQCSVHGYMGNYASIELERSDVTSQDVGRLSGTTSNIQTQIDAIVSSQWTTNANNEIHHTENVGINIADPTEKLDVGGNIKASGTIQGHTVTAQNFNVGGINIVSASAQGTFRDLEVKGSNGNEGLLVFGDTGNTSISGTLDVDTINEKTNGNGVTIDTVLIKDGTVNGQVTTSGTVTAQNFNVGGINIVSASAQGTFRDFEVKGSNGNEGMLVFGDTGNTAISGTTTIEGVLNAKGNIGVSFETPTTKISLGNDNYDQNNVKDKMITFHDNENHYYSIGMAGETTNNAGVGIWSKVEPTKNNAALFVKNNGNIGIGNVVPTEKLDVAGNIKASGTISDGTGLLATTIYVDGKVAELVASAPGHLDTLNELATALNNENDFGTVVNNKLSDIDLSINNINTTIANTVANNTVTLYRQNDMRLTHDKANVKEFTWFREDDERSGGATQTASQITDDNPTLGSDTGWWPGIGFYSSDNNSYVFNNGSPQGIYTGNGSTTVDGNPANGIWFQWEFFEKVKANRFRISMAGALLGSRGFECGPSHITIAGSNDGTTWYSVNSEETMTAADYDGGTTTISGDANRKIGKFAEKNLDQNKLNSYSFYRLIVRGRTGGGLDTPRRMFIGEFELIGSVVLDTNSAGINHITDVDTSTNPPTNGQALIWDNANSKWKPSDVANTTTLNDLTDVSTSGASSNQTLIYDGANWVPGNTTSNINDLTDVNTSGVATNNALLWNGTTWTPGLGGAFSKNGNNAYYNDGNVGIGTDNPTETLTINGSNSSSGTPALGLMSGNDSNHLYNTPQIAFGYNGTNNYQHFIHTRHDSNPTNPAGKNAIDFLMCDGTQNNSVTSGSVNAMSIISYGGVGRVGIGTHNPTEILEVSGNVLAGTAKIGPATQNANYASFCQKNNTGNNDYSLIQTDTGSTRINAKDGQDIDFRIDNNIKMTIDSIGKVGIGTDAPTKNLEVAGDIKFTGDLYDAAGLFTGSRWTESGGNIYRSSGNVGIGINNPSKKLHVHGNAVIGDAATAEQDINFLSQNGNWQVGTNNDGNGTNNNQFYIYDSNRTGNGYLLTAQHVTGNIGIDKTDPTEKLDVTGNIKASGSIEGDSIKIASLNTASNHDKVLMINSSGEIDICNNVSSSGGDSGSGSVWESTSNNKIYYNTANVGIGTSDPTEKLQVNGKILAGSIKFTSLVAETATGSASLATWEIDNSNVILSQTGNVGIGSATPAAKLDINGSIKFAGHILPASNADYDIGSAEYKIRHLFLSDNSLWIGDQHKVDVNGGKIKFKKRKVGSVPSSITSAGGDFPGAKSFLALEAGASESDVTLQQWLNYAKTLDIGGGTGLAEIQDLYNDNAADFDEDNDANYILPAATDSALGGVKPGSGVTISADGTISAASQIWTESGGNISRATGNVGIGTNNPGEKLDVNGNISSTGIWNGFGDFHIGKTSARTFLKGSEIWVGLQDNSSVSKTLNFHRARYDFADMSIGGGTSSGGTLTTCIMNSMNLHIDSSTAHSIYLNHFNSGGLVYLRNFVPVSSDRRIKKNIKVIDDNEALDKILALEAVTYNMIEDEDDVKHYGFIAQDVEKVMPHAVS